MAQSYTAGVVLAAPERASLLALIAADLASRALADPGLSARVAAWHGTAALAAGSMRVVLEFSGGMVHVADSDARASEVEIAGDLSALLDVATSGRYVRALLTRRLRIRGNPLAALRLLPLLTAS